MERSVQPSLEPKAYKSLFSVGPKELSILAINGFQAMQKYEELSELLALVSTLAPERILEIGVGKGGTSWAWSKLSSVKQIIAVDLPNGPWGGGPTEESIKYIKENSNCPYIFFPGNSHEDSTFNFVATELGDHKLDFLMIDGDHSYEGVKADYERYKTLLRPGGIIALHDICTHETSSGCEVEKFWKELRSTVPGAYISIIHDPSTWGGIGITWKPLGK